MVYNQNQRTPMASTAAASADLSDEPDTSPEADSPFEARDANDVTSGDFIAASRSINANASMQYSQEAVFAEDEDDALMQAVQEAEEQYLREKVARESTNAATPATAHGGELSFIEKDDDEEHMEEFLTAQQHSQEYSQFDDADDDMDTDALHQHSQPNSPVNSPLNVLSYRAISHTQEDGDDGNLFGTDSPLSLPNPRPDVAFTDVDAALSSNEPQLDNHTQCTQGSSRSMGLDSGVSEPASAPTSLSPISGVGHCDVTLSATAPTQLATQLATQEATQEEEDEKVNGGGLDGAADTTAVAVVATPISGVVDTAVEDTDADCSQESNVESAQEGSRIDFATVDAAGGGVVEKEREEAQEKEAVGEEEQEKDREEAQEKEEEEEEEEEVFPALLGQSQSINTTLMGTTQHSQQEQPQVSDTQTNTEVASEGMDRVSATATILSPTRTLVVSGHPMDDFADTLVDDEVLVALTQLASP